MTTGDGAEASSFAAPATSKAVVTGMAFLPRVRDDVSFDHMS
jgi:hypothetical protein